MQVFTAGNGMQVAVEKCGSNVGYCCLSTGAGTRDEDGFNSGTAHFTEHTLFKGTSRHSSRVINSMLERLGGELNAFTTKEEIVLHATVLKEDLPRAVSLLAEIATQATFPEEEIEIEKGVVCDEIASYKDSPSDDIYDSFEEKLFEGTPLSSPILGTEDSVRRITSEQLRAFRNKYFIPSKMSLAIVSPLPEDKMAAIAKRICNSIGGQSVPQAVLQTKSQTDFLSQSITPRHFNCVQDNSNHEANCVMGGIAPSREDENGRLTAILLCNILGGPASNSILGSDLREKHGWVYNVDCSYTGYRECGIAAIQFGCDKENLGKCRRAIDRHLNNIREKAFSTAKLDAAKKQILGQQSIAMESGEARCLSMGKSLLNYSRVLSTEELADRIRAITPEQVREMACRLFGADNLSVLTYI